MNTIICEQIIIVVIATINYLKIPQILYNINDEKIVLNNNNDSHHLSLYI